jgi:methylmalonyl-CoA mutase
MSLFRNKRIIYDKKHKFTKTVYFNFATIIFRIIMSESNKLFDQFPSVSTEEWLRKIESDLKGADFEKSMVWKPVDGISVNPFYRSEDLTGLPHIDNMPGEAPFLRGTGKTDNSWYIRESIIVEDSESANKKALSLLNRGVNSLCFVFPPDYKFTAKSIEKLISGIFLEAIEINFQPQGSALELLESIREAITSRGIKPSMLKGAIEADPLGRLMVNGKLCVPVLEGIEYLDKLIKESSDFPNLRVIRVDGSNFGNAGSSSVQELAMTLSMGNEYMSKLTSAGLAADKVADAISFTFGIGSSYFIEIAKLRAARVLWATIINKYQPQNSDSMKMRIHSVTSEWNKTVYDPYVNMLRTQTEAMSATLGGADSLTILPFDKSFASPGEFSQRIARNQQLLLKEESYFDKIADPAAGSYYIENVTTSIAEKAWSLFIEIEKEGGFLEALRKGTIQSRLNETSQKRRGDIAKGKEKLLGTNIFPNLKETSKISIEDLGVGDNPEGSYEVEPLVLGRAGDQFEKLRSATEMHTKRPVVSLLPIGNLTMRKARAQFATSFFGVAGYEVIDYNGFTTVEEGIQMARNNSADLIVLCSSDEEYETFGQEAILLTRGKEYLVIAGAPACADLLRERGVEYFVNIRSNLLETLQMFNNLLGINKK